VHECQDAPRAQDPPYNMHPRFLSGGSLYGAELSGCVGYGWLGEFNRILASRQPPNSPSTMLNTNLQPASEMASASSSSILDFGFGFRLFPVAGYTCSLAKLQHPSSEQEPKCTERSFRASLVLLRVLCQGLCCDCRISRIKQPRTVRFITHTYFDYKTARSYTQH
jgi:hypothetical protein